METETEPQRRTRLRRLLPKDLMGLCTNKRGRQLWKVLEASTLTEPELDLIEREILSMVKAREIRAVLYKNMIAGGAVQ